MVAKSGVCLFQCLGLAMHDDTLKNTRLSEATSQG